MLATKPKKSDLLVNAKADIAAGSKSFAFASALFSPAQRHACWRLYAWCRLADDAVDNASSIDEARTALASVESKTKSAFAGAADPAHPWNGLAQTVSRYQLPEYAALDFLRGLAFDVKEQVQIEDEESLLDYCYCVAGTVGLLMCPIMQVRDPEADRAAVALGSAMQLTNIARDVREDFGRGRVYIPQTWLRERKMTSKDLFSANGDALRADDLRAMTLQMLTLAEDLYNVGLAGLRFLPWRAAWAVQVAAYIYRDIGREILKQSADNSTNYRFERVVIGRSRKISLFVAATYTLTKVRLFGASVSPTGKRKQKRTKKEGLRRGFDIIPS